MRRVNRPRLAAATVLFVTALLYVPINQVWGDRTWAADATNVITTAQILFASILLFYAAWRHQTAQVRQALALLGAGVASWGVAMVVWTILMLRGVPPWPSAADFFFLASLPLLCAGLLRWPRHRVRPSVLVLVDGILVAAIAVAITVEFVIAPIASNGLTTWQSWLALAYPLLDLTVVLILVAVHVLGGWTDRGRIAIFTVGAALLVAADAAFAMNGGVVTTLQSVGWGLAFAFFGLTGVVPRNWANARHGVPAAAGPLAVAIVIGAVVIERATRENPTTIDIAAAASLMALLVLRYWVLARAHGRETKQAHALAAELTEMHVRERAMRDRFMAEVVRARDEEARRIAEMLHDDAVQQLTALGLRLELAAISSGDETLDDLAASAGEVTASVRRLLIELHPAVLESQGLAPALTVASESLRATGVSVEVMRFDRRLAPETERLAYRLVQEALANAMKHARATAVRVEIAADERTLRCRVVDNGAGFHTAALSKGIVDGHFGLHLVRERVEHAGGRFLIESSPGGGTTFIIELPLARHAEAAAATA